MIAREKNPSNSLPNHEKLPNFALSGLRVLLVEDEFDLASLVVFVLQQLGADVRLVFTADEALQLIHRCQPDLLICNVQLPTHDGIWLIRQVRFSGIHSQRLPAIALSSSTRDVYYDTLLASGFQRFLVKPITPDKLAVEVCSLTRRAL